MTYRELWESARENLARGGKALCKACLVCNGVACRSTMPGPGAKGVGDGAIRNFNAWQNIRLNMDTIYEHGEVDTSFELFGKKFKAPIFAGPVGAVQMHYSDALDDVAYNKMLTKACTNSGIAAFTGDGIDPNVMSAAVQAIKECGGNGIPTVKPWNLETVQKKFDMIEEANPFAVAMDIDGAGLPFLKNMEPPAGCKSIEELSKISAAAKRPFIVKGIMTARGALKALEGGASAIVVSNHGGRVLDQCPATAEVLPEIVAAVGGRMKILVDGGIRTGSDVFKALALGADAVLIARTFVIAAYGDGERGVSFLAGQIASELEDAMRMTGALTLKDISPDMVRVVK